MQFSIHLTHYRAAGAPEPAVEFAQQAESLGFDAVWVGDHIVSPKRVEAVYPNGPPGSIRRTQASGAMPDPFVLLGIIGAKTTTIRLGFSVLVVPYRPAVLQAKQIATLDALTDGRVIVGVGSGWHVQEFEALGVPFSERGPRTDEAIEVWRKLWTGENVDFDGRFSRFEEMFALPRPIRSSAVPIWVGGHSRAARRRTALLGDGWYPTSLSPDGYRDGIAEIRRLAAEVGRPAPLAAFNRRMRIVDTPDALRDLFDPYATLVGTPDEIIRAVRAYEAAGVEHLKISTGSEDPAEVPVLMDRFAREVMPAFAF